MIRSDRYRADGTAVANQLSPQDNNQTENVYAFYVEDAQRFFDDRLTVRGGVRQTYGNTALDSTPNAPTLLPGSKNYEATTYSAGATFAVTDWLNTRVGASTGFRAPTATELGANFTVTPIGTTIFGNPNLRAGDQRTRSKPARRRTGRAAASTWRSSRTSSATASRPSPSRRSAAW